MEEHIASSWACHGMDGPCIMVPWCYGAPSAELLYEPRTPHHEESVRAQPLFTDFHCLSRSAMSSARFSSSRPSRMLMSWGSARQ